MCITYSFLSGRGYAQDGGNSGFGGWEGGGGERGEKSHCAPPSVNIPDTDMAHDVNS